MKNTLPVITLLTFVGLLSCDQIDFLPIKGTIEGIITDNNGVLLPGIDITATFEAPSESGQAQEEILTTTTDAEGYYRLTELWDEVSLSINNPGFRPVFRQVDLAEKYNPQLDITLEGSPSILAIVPNATALSASTQDTLIVDIEVSDTFNSEERFYEVNLLLQNEAGVTQAIIPATNTFAGSERFLFEALAMVDDLQLPLGSYTITAEVLDSDGNIQQKQGEQAVIIE
ncbi:MAG: carboxypeptidase-like regulatory domain-containing protein [Cyclobacteriaceae bacterium]